MSKNTNKLYFVRHGESTANDLNIVSPDDVSLTKKGVTQSRQSGKALAKMDIGIIISSPLPRALQTAQIIAEELSFSKQDIKVVDELKERDLGNLVGLTRQYENEFYYTANAEHRIESKDELIERVKNALSKIIHITTATNKSAIIVGHCISGYYLLQVAKGHHSFDDFDQVSHLDNAVIAKFELDKAKLQ